MTISIKFCGVTTPEDAAAAVKAGADWIGLNFSAQSVRRVSVEQARSIIGATPEFHRFTGVFVEQTSDEVEAVRRELALAYRQTYSTPWPEGSIAAFRVRSAEDIAHIRALLATSPKPMAVLIDSYVAGAMGGTGHKAPWELLAEQDFAVPLILAGGLTPDNVAEAIRVVKLWGVDVASGIESSPGRKDAGKMRAFVAAVRGAERAH